MKLYIIVQHLYDNETCEILTVESVWDNRQLAEAAMRQHADEADIPTSHYEILERNLNSIKNGLK